MSTFGLFRRRQLHVAGRFLKIVMGEVMRSTIRITIEIGEILKIRASTYALPKGLNCKAIKFQYHLKLSTSLMPLKTQVLKEAISTPKQVKSLRS